MMIAANIISMTILFAVPLLLVAMGGMFSEHSGVINIALEGMMIIGALTIENYYAAQINHDLYGRNRGDVNWK